VRGALVTQEPQRSRRDEILRAAEAVFAEAGYDRARLEDVALRVGIRRASLLYHFRDKTALYSAVLESLFDDLVRRYRRVLEGGGTAGARLERTVDAWLDFVAARPAILPIMLRELADGVTDGSRPFAERAKPVFAAFNEVISAGQAAGTLRRTDGVQVLMMLGGASTFLTLGGTVVASAGAVEQPAIADRGRQRELLVAVFRKLLGTRGPGRVVAGRSDSSEVQA
jgi:TetR/AcrR family transcriptional regulator